MYRDFLVFASAAKTDQVYNVQACIGLSELSIEEVDNGKGMQGHCAKIPKMLPPRTVCRLGRKLTQIRTAVPYGPVLLEAGLRMRSSTLRGHHDCLFIERGA